MILQHLTILGANFAFIFLKAFQQRNVAFDNYLWVLPTSYAMAVVEVYVIASIAAIGFTPLLAFTIGTAAGSGALGAMWLHRRYLMNGVSNGKTAKTPDSEAEGEHSSLPIQLRGTGS